MATMDTPSRRPGTGFWLLHGCLLATAPGHAESLPKIDFEAVVKLDVLRHGDEGRSHRESLLSNLDLNFQFTSPSWRAFVHVLDNRGGQPNAHIASAQGIDNIEVEYPATRLHDAWLEYVPAAWSGWGIKSGIYDLNSEFYATDSSGLFLHPAFGIGSELAQTGVLGPSIFPYTGLGLRLQYQTESSYIQAAILDAVPGDPRHPRSLHLELGDDEGALGVTEAGWTWQRGEAPGKLALGLWRYSTPFTRWDGGRDRNQGAYLLLEHPLDENGALRGFLRAGLAPGSINQFNHAVNAGLAYRDPFGRVGDEIGLGISYEHNSHDWMAAMRAAGEPAPRFEMAYELAYRLHLSDWLSIQPDVQLVSNHGARAEKRATVLGMRLIASY